MKDILKQVMVAIMTAAILGTAAGVWNLIMEVKGLRYDVDRLYAEVSEHQQEEH
jgi:hypothetical protein